MKRGRISASIAFFLLILSVLVTVIDFCSFQKTFYEQEYLKDHTAEKIGMSDEDLMSSTSALLDYLRDSRESISISASVNGYAQQVYSERETRHMKDVKQLYQHAIILRNTAFLTGLAFLLYSMLKNKEPRSLILKTGYKNGMMTVGALIVFITVAALADFDAFWISFHKLFFN
ncbi:MAG: DUF1461 domain-containing protein, partial [Erysipelotrichia bacterium]|nr:DUF1461 domain-containing protein [Erysipelotrichia bacterium]